MTTPETARTAEQATEYARLIAAQERTQYQRKVYLSRNGHAPSAEAYRECLAEEAAAFVAAVRSCLPEPQASKASDDDAPVHPEVAWQAVQQLADDIDRKIMGDSAPAGEAVSDGMSLVLHLSDYECRTDHEEAAAFRHFRAKAADIVRAMAVKAASAPPPSTGDKPQPIYTRDNLMDIAQEIRNAQVCVHNISLNESCIRCTAHINSAYPPPPPPAPASKGDDDYDAVLRKEIGSLRETAARLAAELARAAPLSVSREGFTFPDSAVEKLLSLIDWQNAFVPADFRHHMCQDAAALRAARVTLPQQGEDDWRATECEVQKRDTNRWVVMYAARDDKARLYLWARHWLEPQRWCVLDDNDGYFPSESAARAALAQAPRPTT
jgi:hypothetical protein